MSYSGSKNDPGYKRAKRLAEKGRVSYDNAYRILDDMQNGRDGAMLDPDGTLKHELETKVGTRADISRSQRNSNIDTESKYKAQGVTYTPNGHNVIGIIYNNGNK